MGKGKVILRTKISREKGKLYFCGTDSEGNITVCETMMARGKRKEKKK